MILSTNEIKEAYNGQTPLTEILYKGVSIWSSGSWELDVNDYIDKGDGFYYQKLIKYGEITPGVKFETPASTYTSYDFIDDTESPFERKPGIKYLMSNNKDKHNTWAQVKLSWEDIEDWELGYMSDAESSYDYIVVSGVDASEWKSLPSDSAGSYNTKGKQNTKFVSSFSGEGSHHIYVAFRKDSSASSGKDRGYIYFPEERKEIVDIKAGNLLPYTYEDYGDVIVEDDGYYQKLIYTAQLPNGEYVTNQDNYVKGEKVDIVSEYGGLAFEAVNDSTVSLTLKPGISLFYSIKDKSAWLPFDATSEISLTNGETMYVRGINPETDSSIKFKLLGGINASGNVMSIYYGDDFDGKVTPQSTDINGMAYLFSGSTGLLRADELILPLTKLNEGYYMYMFNGCTGLTSAPELPATTLSSSCYYNMFNGCTGLTSAPELPATTLSSSCYYNMFRGCTGLTTAPELPATTLAASCYQSMFYGCTSLTTAPALPATELASYCYAHMFRDCTSLVNAPELPATTLAASCYESMFRGCTSLTTAPELPNTELAGSCYQHMFNGCTSLTTAPELPATTLSSVCYSNMFYGCTSLTTAPELPATTLADGCYTNMFYGCTSLTTAPELPATTLLIDCYTGMFGNCSKLNYVKANFTTKPSATYCNSWLSRVASTGTFVANPEATWPSEITRGSSTVPSGWTIQQ